MTKPAFHLALVTLTIVSLAQPAQAGDVVPFQLCGRLVQAPFCGLVLASTDGVFLVDDPGPFVAGDLVTISGPITGPCITLPRCSSDVCVEVQTITAGACEPSADLDVDSDVDAADLAQLLSAWGECPPFAVTCPGDLDFDGQVGASDLSVLLGQWTGSL